MFVYHHLQGARMKTTHFIAVIFILLGCARAQIKNEILAYKAGTITKSDVILVKPISADSAIFTGDKSEEKKRVEDERKIIKESLSTMIVEQLNKAGFSAKVYTPSEKILDNTYLLEGKVTRFEHGSGAARMLVGMGAGSSNMYIPVKVFNAKSKKSVAEFEVVATSGGRGGLISMGSFLDAHMADASEKIAQYLGEK